MKRTFTKASYWNRLVKKFYNLNNKIINLISSRNASRTEVNILIERLQKLFRKLKRLRVKAGVKLAGSALALMFATTTLNAQQYQNLGHLTANKFINQEMPAPSVCDFDGDGTLDLFVASPNNFTQRYTVRNNFIELIDTVTYNGYNLNFPHPVNVFFVDVDDDGDLDMYTGVGGYLYIPLNDGTGNFVNVSIVTAGGSYIEVSTDFIDPTLADIDDDGDLDLFIGDGNGYVLFAEAADTGFMALDTVMIDTAKLKVEYYASPALADLDGDGDLDLYVGDMYGRINVFENDSGNFTFQGLLQADGDTIDLGYYANITFADLDGDGDLDLLYGIYNISTYDWEVDYFKNDGNGNFSFDKKLFYPTGEINNGVYASVSMADIDSDGDYDLFTGNINSPYIFEYKNYKGNFFFVDTLRDDGGNKIATGTISDPEFVDLDGDGDLDLYIGNRNGTIVQYSNDGNNNFTLVGNLQADGTDIDVGYWSAPDFYDIDNDGDLDLFVGASDGYIHFFENDGTGNFLADSLLTADGSPIFINMITVPEFADYDDDGDMDLLVGVYPSGIYKYKNDGNGNFSADGMLNLSADKFPHIETKEVFNTCHYDYLIADNTGYITAYKFQDVRPPIPNVSQLPTVIGECSVTLNPPAAHDNCDSLVIGTTSQQTTFDQQGIYTVTWQYTDASGNSSYQQQVVIVRDSTPPIVAVIADTTVYTDTTNTFTVSGTDFDPVNVSDNCEIDTVYNSWNNTNTLDGEVFDPGVYFITWFAKDVGGNLTYSTVQLTVESTVAVEQIGDAKISVYPNPSDGLFTVNGVNGCNLAVYDVNGKLVSQYDNIVADKLSLDLTPFGSGMYFVKIYNDKGVKNIKVVVK